MSIELIAEAIGEIASEITAIQTVYTKPIFELSRKLPAILVMYDGFEQSPLELHSDVMDYKYELTVYYRLEGTDIGPLWTRVCGLANTVVSKYRQHYTLHGTVLKSRIISGRPIVDVPTTVQAKPKWIGHTFKLIASAEEF